MSTLSQFGFGGGIKSIQTIIENQILYGNSIYIWSTIGMSGNYSSSKNVTINPINPNKTVLIYNYGGGSANSGKNVTAADIIPFCYVEILNSTTIKISGSASYKSDNSLLYIPTVHIQVVEYH